MKVKVEVVENATGKTLANSFMDEVTFEEVMSMVDETWSIHSTPATGWMVGVSKCEMRKRVWNFGEKLGLNCFVTTYIMEVQ